MFWFLLQGSCAADLYRHPQLDADIEAVKDIYTDSAVSVRYSTRTDIIYFLIQFRKNEKDFVTNRVSVGLMYWHDWNIMSAH